MLQSNGYLIFGAQQTSETSGMSVTALERSNVVRELIGMLVREAEVVAEMLQSSISQLPHKATILNIGSSTAHFRTVVQPHIAQLVFQPLEIQGHRIFHIDLKHEKGVDLCGDITDPAFQIRLQSLSPDVVLCSNILEHVADIAEFCAALNVLGRNAQLLITCPRNYPYHPDPIDNGFRPDALEIGEKFPNHRLVSEEHAVGEKLKDRLKGWSVIQKTKFLAATLKGSILGRTRRDDSVLVKSLPGILTFWNAPFTATVALFAPE